MASYIALGADGMVQLLSSTLPRLKTWERVSSQQSEAPERELQGEKSAGVCIDTTSHIHFDGGRGLLKSDHHASAF